MTATVLALETRDGKRVLDQAIMVTFDLVRMTKEVHEGLQRVAAEKLADFDSTKLICGATHTHCGPSISYARTGPGQLYDISDRPDVMTPQQYILLLYEKVGAGIVEAWQTRKPAGVSWGLGNAVVGYNRRLSYADGSAIMGFDTARPDFSHVEGYEDHAVEMLFFWDADQKLTGMLLNLACPSQVGRKAISADFWHPIRQGIKAKYGADLHVFAQCAAAGDQCPEVIVRSQAEKLMLGRRKTSWKEELANRVIRAVDDVWPYAQAGVQTRLSASGAQAGIPNKNSTTRHATPSAVAVELHALVAATLRLPPIRLNCFWTTSDRSGRKAVLTFLSQYVRPPRTFVNATAGRVDKALRNSSSAPAWRTGAASTNGQGDQLALALSSGPRTSSGSGQPSMPPVADAEPPRDVRTSSQVSHDRRRRQRSRVVLPRVDCVQQLEPPPRARQRLRRPAQGQKTLPS